MISKNNKAPLLYYIKLCALFEIHWWIQTGVRKRSILVKIDTFLCRVTLQFDGWKKIGHFFYTTLSFVHHFQAIGIFKLELQSGNALLGSKLVIFLSRMILKIDGWPWKTIGHFFYTMSSFVQLFPAYPGVVWGSVSKNTCSRESIFSVRRIYGDLYILFLHYGVSFQIHPLFYIMPYERLCLSLKVLYDFSWNTRSVTESHLQWPPWLCPGRE